MMENIKRKWLDIPELRISVEVKVHSLGKSFQTLNLDNLKADLLNVEQCIWLANSKYAKKLGMNGRMNKDSFFIQQPFNLNKRNDYVALFWSLGKFIDFNFS